jgi:hypothetical protein
VTNEAKRNEDAVEPLVRLGLLLVGMTLTITGWALDWRGYVQGVGCGMCVVLTVWGGFALAKLWKPNAKGERHE